MTVFFINSPARYFKKISNTDKSEAIFVRSPVKTSMPIIIKSIPEIHSIMLKVCVPGSGFY